IEGDVEFDAFASSDRLTDIKHRRVIALAFADHDTTFDGERIERGAHRVDGRLIGSALIGAAYQPRGGDGGVNWRPGKRQRQLVTDDVAHERLQRGPAVSTGITNGGSAVTSSASIARTAASIFARAHVCVVSTIGTAGPSCTGICRKLSIEISSCASLSEMAATTPGRSFTRRRR